MQRLGSRERKTMIRKTLAFLSLFMIVSTYVHMYFDHKALGVYGTKKPFGKTCLFVDAKLNISRKHLKDHELGYGVHGCPIFIDLTVKR